VDILVALAVCDFKETGETREEAEAREKTNKSGEKEWRGRARGNTER
jgi:hypothetical protein